MPRQREYSQLSDRALLEKIASNTGRPAGGAEKHESFGFEFCACSTLHSLQRSSPRLSEMRKANQSQLHRLQSVRT